MPSNTLSLPGTFAGGKYTLPDLPYPADALEPNYKAEALQIHHDRHHAAYVKGLNTAMESLEKARAEGNFERVQALSNATAFHGSGHVLHTLFWHSMTPGGADIGGDFAPAIKESFGSVDAFKKQFVEAAKAVEGSGWAVLAYEPLSDRMVILQAEKHQNLTVWGVTPLLVADVWEHAYYLQYQNKRDEWLAAFMKMANWQFAASRLAAARAMRA